VEGKTSEYKAYAKEQRAIAYGTCAGVCVVSLASGCAPCYAAAAAILETKLSKFRKKNEELRDSYNEMARKVDNKLEEIKVMNWGY